MLDFCPFDFNKIDMNNLAYELVFADEWTWERVKKETVIGKVPNLLSVKMMTDVTFIIRTGMIKDLWRFNMLFFWKTGIQEEKTDFSSCWN